MEHVSEKKRQDVIHLNWDDIVCPICLDSPHNAVLLQCSSYQNGCRAFLCHTDHLHSNCLDRFITSSGTHSPPPPPPPPVDETMSKVLQENCKPLCPLCRGEVTGWVVVEEARPLLDDKKRSCEEERCRFTGTYTELREHAKSEHPDSRPSKIDPSRKLDWENFQQSSEIIDVLSTIHSEVPRGVVLGDYVIEYGGDDDTGDEFEDVPGNEGSWWTSCILYKMFDNIRNARRNRRRSRMIMRESRRGSRRSSYDNSNSDDSSVASIEFPVYRVDEIDDEFITTNGVNRSSSMHPRFALAYNSRRRRSRFYVN